MAERPVRSVGWRALRWPGTEYCELSRYSRGWLLGGSVVAAPDGDPLELRYEVRTDDRWLTRRVVLDLRAGGAARHLELDVDDLARWWRRPDELSDVSGALDVDIEVSPSTNTLPIRRLSLDVGASADVTAAWVRVPSLEVEPLRQRYARVGEDRYRYESLDSGFAAELRVDDEGLVVTYGEIWDRVASSG